jgi:hypothetical protein
MRRRDGHQHGKRRHALPCPTLLYQPNLFLTTRVACVFMCVDVCTPQLRLIEECEDLEEGMLQLATDLFPTFADLFEQVKAADRPFAAQCLRHYIEFVRGPPNRRTRDARGLMRPILHFLQDHQ